MSESRDDFFEKYMDVLKRKNRRLLAQMETPRKLKDAAKDAKLSYALAFEAIAPLQKAGLVYRERVGREFFYCSSESALKSFMESKPKLSEDVTHIVERHRRILEAINTPGTPADIQGKIEINYKTLQAALKQLLAAGMVSRSKTGRSYVFSRTEEAEKRLPVPDTQVS